MVTVRLTDEAREHFTGLQPTIKARILAVFERLQKWPSVSGAKPLKNQWAGHFRIRTGDWRIIFRPVSQDVLIVRIKHRSEIYDE
jgi:mRNA-degrading endonuclease RelE of RelBE toxin-antitoxin system